MAADGDRPRKFELLERERVYQGFFALDRLTLRHERFAGGWSETFQRELFCTKHAIGVLPYDPVRDRLVLIEQFRTGPLATSPTVEGAQPWVIETPAGLIERDEEPLAGARRELAEETGLVAQRMELATRFYASPGASSEFVSLFIAEVDLPGEIGIHGLPHEHEDIMCHVLDSAEATAWMADGRIEGVTAVMALLWMKAFGQALRDRWLETPAAAG